MKSIRWRKFTRRQVIATSGVLLVLLFATVPRHVDLRAFDPVAMGRRETRMWRDYYEHRPGHLVWGLCSLNRSQFGFSPWDSAWLAVDAAQAAMLFQPTRDRAESQRALPPLRRYFGRIVRRSGVSAEPGVLAERELDWWQRRREHQTAAGYGRAVAKLPWPGVRLGLVRMVSTGSGNSQGTKGTAEHRL